VGNKTMKTPNELDLEYKAIPPEVTSKVLKFLWANKYEIISLAIWTYQKIKELITKKKEQKNEKS
jgi:hypothetical protein